MVSSPKGGDQEVESLDSGLRHGGGSSIAARRAAKFGFDASRIKMPSLSSSRLLSASRPPCVSPTALLDSPIMLPNTQVKLTFHFLFFSLWYCLSSAFTVGVFLEILIIRLQSAFWMHLHTYIHTHMDRVIINFFKHFSFNNVNVNFSSQMIDNSLIPHRSHLSSYDLLGCISRDPAREPLLVTTLGFGWQGRRPDYVVQRWINLGLILMVKDT